LTDRIGITRMELKGATFLENPCSCRMNPHFV
jgi:hypothetical protein